MPINWERMKKATLNSLAGKNKYKNKGAEMILHKELTNPTIIVLFLELKDL